jgi:hypothetical protein
MFNTYSIKPWSFINVLQDLDSRVNELIVKFEKNDIKRLEVELADHTLQSRFDAQANAKLTQWESLVYLSCLPGHSSQLTVCRMQTVIRRSVTRKVETYY